MASPQLITRDNFSANLARSTNPRGSTPNGNVYFDTANDRIQLITLSELSQVDLGGGLEANPLTDTDKIQLLALYFFALQEVEADPALQQFLTAVDAVGNRMGRLVGATAFLNAIKLSDGSVDINGAGGALGDDRLKLADSGFTEFAAGGGGNTLIDRVYHGAKSVNNIEGASQPFYQISASLSEADRQAAAPIDFSKTGDVNEVIQTFGSTANGDTGAGSDDNRSNILILGVRSFGFTSGEASSSALGVAELGAYSQGYPLGETAVQALSGLTEADVFGGSAVAPYTGISFSRETSPQIESGFNEADGNFTDVISNANGASLIQIRAWMDKFSQQDTDENTNTGSTGAFLPKRAEPLYTIDATGKLITRQGVFIENISAADEQNIVFTDDAGATKTRPFNVGIVVKLSAAWFADTSPWFRLMYSDGAGGLDFDTSSAVTATDASSVAVSGDGADGRVFSVNSGEYYELRFGYAYDQSTEAGLNPGEDKDMVFQVGGVDKTKRRTISFTISRVSSLSFDASSEAETN